MEEFKEYIERFVEWFLIFIKSRWIKGIIFTSLLIGFGISIAFSILGMLVSPTWYHDNIKEIYGHMDWAILGLITGIFGFIWILIIISNDPSTKKRKKFRKFYKAWKLWYWMPSLLSLMILELLIRLIVILGSGKYIPEDLNEKKELNKYSIYKKWKLWYWIPTLGIAIIFEYITIFTRIIQKNSLYYWDLVLLIAIILIISMSLGVLSYEVRYTSIRRIY